jgi:isoleucyl-tRNA synthetase
MKMTATRQAVSMGRALRSLHNLKIRQPLKAIHLVTIDPQERRVLREMEDIIREELNVKDVVFRENEDELVEYSAKPNYRILGRQLGKDMKAAAAKIESLDMQEIQQIIEGAVLSIDIGTRSLELTRDSIVVQRHEKENLKVLNEGSLTVALDPEITEELRREGMVRDMVRGVQNLRKESGLDVTDRIALTVSADGEMKQAVEDFEDFLMNETLAVSIAWDDHKATEEIECGDAVCRIAIERVESREGASA